MTTSSTSPKNSSTKEPEVRLVVDWNDLPKLEKELQLAADRLEIRKAKKLTINVAGSKRGVTVRLQTDQNQVLIPINPSPLKVKEPISDENPPFEATQNDISERSGGDLPPVTTAEMGTQTESLLLSPQHVLVTSYSFAPYELKRGKQIKCIQVTCVKL